MFLIRTAFWLSVVIMLLPAEEPASALRHDAAARAEADTGRFVAAARDTISDLSGLCQRNPDVCAVGAEAVDLFMRKARYGAGLVVRMLSDEPGAARPAAPLPAQAMPPARTAAAEPAAPVARNTLTADDLRPTWRGPDDRNI